MRKTVGAARGARLMAHVSRRTRAVALAPLLSMNTSVASSAEDREAADTHPIQQLVDHHLDVEFTWYTGSARYSGSSRSRRPWPDYRLVEKLTMKPRHGVRLTDEVISVFLRFPTTSSG